MQDGLADDIVAITTSTAIFGIVVLTSSLTRPVYELVGTGTRAEFSSIHLTIGFLPLASYHEKTVFHAHIQRFFFILNSHSLINATQR